MRRFAECALAGDLFRFIYMLKRAVPGGWPARFSRSVKVRGGVRAGSWPVGVQLTPPDVDGLFAADVAVVGSLDLFVGGGG